MRPIEQTALYPIINPKSLAVFGASNKYASMGTNLLTSIMSLGFEGNIYPVHLTEKSVKGLPAYASVEDLPEIPELALMVLPTRIVPEALEACGRKGIRRAIVVSGGFKEVGGDGAALEEQICGIANRHGIRFLGPNCIGVANPHHKFNATFLPCPRESGFIGVASQSGSFITQMFDYLIQFGQAFSAGISVGNEANIDLVDCLEYLGACPRTKVIGLYVETIRRGREFIDMARSIVPHKPIVAYYVGGSEAGRKASLSHTGALSGPDRLYDGVFAQSGVIRAFSIEELFDFCWCLGAVPKPAGNRVLIQTHSGGPGAVAADACSRAGLVLPPISAETLDKLSPYMPHTASAANPVDITYTKKSMDYFTQIPKILLDDENSDAMLMYFLMSEKSVIRAMEGFGIIGEEAVQESRKFIDEQSQSVVDMIKSHPKPCIGFSFYNRENQFVANLQDKGIVVLPSPTRAARALAAMVRYVKLREKIMSGL
ncbi:MAG: CoA-binding protein [Desulfobacterales bacterium]|jgi:acyl-CoA synthetase (NDP forming)|nr:CoA-binding protein [Desulfobacterales bacterium]